MELSRVVEEFAAGTQSMQDSDLERDWAWGEYDEGVRFAFFLTYDQLRDLAAEIAALRRKSGAPQTLAQHIVGQYQTAYRDLQSMLLGIDDEIARREPAPGEWPIRQALLHMLQTERNFFIVCDYAAQRVRSGGDRPLEISDEEVEVYWTGDSFEDLRENGELAGIMAGLDRVHTRVVAAFAGLSDDELEAPSVFWESTPFPVRFRLHRFDAHMRQHTIQIEKTRLLLGLPYPEILRLWRLMYAALAEVEAVSLGAGEIGKAEREALAEEIAQRRAEIIAVMSGEVQAGSTDR